MIFVNYHDNDRIVIMHYYELRYVSSCTRNEFGYRPVVKYAIYNQRKGVTVVQAFGQVSYMGGTIIFKPGGWGNG
jgi:hypothetical protein